MTIARIATQRRKEVTMTATKVTQAMKVYWEAADQAWGVYEEAIDQAEKVYEEATKQE